MASHSGPVSVGKAAPVTSAATSVVVQRKCGCSAAGERPEEREARQLKPIQRSAVGPSGAAPPDASAVQLGSSGQPLPGGTRALMESYLRHDFSSVRIHADAAADRAAQALSAQAYTSGRDIVFAAGQFDPESRAGQQLLAHELTHVVQQARGNVGGRDIGFGVRLGSPQDAFEREADVAAAGLPAFSRVSAGPAAPADVRPLNGV